MPGQYVISFWIYPRVTIRSEQMNSQEINEKNIISLAPNRTTFLFFDML
jgi:hypothetical protein